MKKILLSDEDAYRAMFLFLEGYYELTKADDVAALLGSMSILQDGKPADMAMWSEWQSAIDATIRSRGEG